MFFSDVVTDDGIVQLRRDYCKFRAHVLQFRIFIEASSSDYPRIMFRKIITKILSKSPNCHFLVIRSPKTGRTYTSMGDSDSGGL